MPDTVTLKKISDRVSETSTVHCGWGIRGNGSTQPARWAAIKDGEHVATLYSDGGIWLVVTPKMFRLLMCTYDRPAGIRWIAENL